MTSQTYESPDGKLRLVVAQYDDGDTVIGFEGLPWHTHGDLLIPLYGRTETAAVARFVADILENRATIAVYRVRGTLSDVRITYDPKTDTKYLGDGETVEHRFWDRSACYNSN